MTRIKARVVQIQNHSLKTLKTIMIKPMLSVLEILMKYSIAHPNPLNVKVCVNSLVLISLLKKIMK